MRRIIFLLLSVFTLLSCSNDDDCNPSRSFEPVEMNIPEWLIGTWGEILPDGTPVPYFLISENNICQYTGDGTRINNCAQEEVAALRNAGIEVAPDSGWSDYNYAFTYIRGTGFITQIEFLTDPSIPSQITWIQWEGSSEITLYRLD